MKPRIDFSVDKTEVAVGDIVEIKWKCNGDEDSTELSIDNGFRQLTEAVETSGRKRIRINRASAGSVQISLMMVISGQTYSRTITIGVLNKHKSANDEIYPNDLEVYEGCQEQETEAPWWRNLIFYVAAFLITVPIFPFIYRLIPDFNWSGWDRILEFVLLYICVAAVLSIRWWIDLVAFVVMVAILTVGTVKGNGYGFKQLFQDYAVFKHAREHKNDIVKYDKPPPKPVRVPQKNDIYKQNLEPYALFKKKIENAVDYTNPIVRDFAGRQTTEEPFAKIGAEQRSEDIMKIVHAFAVFKTINNNWKYVHDPRCFEYNSKASETITNSSNGKFTGDCDDHAILMAACVQAVGAKARIVCSRENGKGHAYPEVFLGSRQNAETTNYLIGKLFPQYRGKRDFNYHVDDNGDYWLNLDYSDPYPGGEFIQNKDSIKLVIDDF